MSRILRKAIAALLPVFFAGSVVAQEAVFFKIVDTFFFKRPVSPHC